MSKQHTMIFTAPASASPGWQTFRVKTGSSTYHVAFGPLGSRRVAVLRGDSHGNVIHEIDGDPRVGEASLFGVSPGEWVGKPLLVGGVITSPVVAVSVEDDPEVLSRVPTWLTLPSTSAPTPVFESAPRLIAQPVAQPVAPPLAGAELYVSLVEAAGRRLRAVADADDLVEAFAERPELRERFGDELAACLLTVKGIARRMG